MSQKQTFTNTFIGGMAQDSDKKIQRNQTYRYAIGARLAMNNYDNLSKSFEDIVKEGVSLAIVNARGNRFEIALCAGYKLIGSINSNEGTLLLMTDGLNSEIGLLNLNDNIFAANHVTYTTLFNDALDPNGDRLNFKQRYYAHGFYVFENEFTRRFYWVDGFNQKRTINLPLFYDEQGNPIHKQGCNQITAYPKHLSVHSFDERMDLVFPRIKFQQRIPGALKSGQYQLLMKYVSKNGHSSVWSPITRTVWVTDQKIDGTISHAGISYPEAQGYQSNHHNRTMGASNIMTDEGLRWELTGLDTRWDKIVIGYIYHVTDSGFQEANEYKTFENFGSNLIVDLVGHTGTAISRADINQRYETVLSIGTTAEQENRTWDGNIELLPDMTLDLSAVTIEAHVRYYRPDETDEPKFDPVFNPVTGRDDNDPLTNSKVRTQQYNINSFGSTSEVYTSTMDFQNYRGQQFSHLFKGYFRGETQPFALVMIDRKGNPLFAQHIMDFTFPNQFDRFDDNGNPTDWTLTRTNPDGTYDFRIMGAMFNNIELPAEKLYDKFGKLNVSGFMIVRTERIKRIANQGVLFQCVRVMNGKTGTNTDRYIQPLLSWNNEFDPPYYPGDPDQHLYFGAIGSNYDDSGVDSSAGAPSAAYYFNYHSPDVLIEEAINDQQLAGHMQLIGYVHKAKSEFIQLATIGKWGHHYTKSYRTSPLEWTRQNLLIRSGRPKIGDKSRIKLGFVHDQGTFHVYEKFDPETAFRDDYRANIYAFLLNPNIGTGLGGRINNDHAWKATQQPGSVIMKLMDFESIDSSEGPFSRSSYSIVNWLQSPSGYYTDTDQSSLEKRIYYPTGHYQPITEDILNAVSKKLKPNGQVDAFVFNKVEVWGGDCYNTVFDFTRLYPEYTNCTKVDGQFDDFSVSHIVPIESKYNLDLIHGRRFAKNSVNPKGAACSQDYPQFSNGIMPEQPEDWFYNRVLNVQENTRAYNPKPADQKIIENAPSTIWWSPKKLYGELNDSYRQRLVGDHGEIVGSYGAIQKFTQAFNSLYVIQESGFGLLQTNLRTFIPTDAGDIYVKSGDVFGGAQYYSKKYGTQHPNSVWSDDNYLGFTDARMGKILVFTQAGLSAASEDDLVNDAIMAKTIYFDRSIEHDPGNGRFVDIVAGVDFENHEVLTTFHHTLPMQIQGSDFDRVNELKSFTIQYNKTMRNFHGFQHFTPYIYLNHGRYMLAPGTAANDQNQLYLFNHGKYGQWYGRYYPTIIEFQVNDQPNVAKVFDNGVINVTEEGWKRISEVRGQVNKNVHVIITAEKSGNTIVFPDDRVTWMEDKIRLPLHEYDWEGVKERLRGNVLNVRIVIDNSQQEIDGEDLQCAITNFDTILRFSHPVQY